MSEQKDFVDAQRGVEKVGGAAAGVKELDSPDGFYLQHNKSAKTQTLAEFTSDVYNMKNRERGVAVIFDNRNFNQHTGLPYPQRQNPEDDFRDVTELLGKLGFKDIRSKPDMSVENMIKTMKEVSMENHTENDCFVCVILSYGDEGYVWGSNNRVAINELMEPLKGNNCPSLAGKPKLFFIQADPEDQKEEEIDLEAEAEGEIQEDRKIPAHADLFMVVSVVPKYSGRSCFIQSLNEVVLNCNLSELDLTSLMTRVNRKVARCLEEKHDHKFIMNRKLPCITSMLTKELYFKA